MDWLVEVVFLGVFVLVATGPTSVGTVPSRFFLEEVQLGVHRGINKRC